MRLHGWAFIAMGLSVIPLVYVICRMSWEYALWSLTYVVLVASLLYYLANLRYLLTWFPGAIAIASIRSEALRGAIAGVFVCLLLILTMAFARGVQVLF